MEKISIINLKSVQLKILKFLSKQTQSFSGSRIAREIDSTWTMVSKHLKILEKKKFVFSKLVDGRTNSWKITTEGKQVVEQIFKLEKLLK